MLHISNTVKNHTERCLVIFCMFPLISGETSAGKSTLINKILGKIIFIGTTSESTSTICKIRNLERVRIITENLKGEIDETDLTATCDIQSQSGEELLRTTLTDLTDMTSSGNFKEVKYVDVGFPIPFLQVITKLTFFLKNY